MALEIKFGTDGWRAAVAKEFTVENVARIAQGTADWVKSQGLPQVAVVGHDCRFGGPMFAETVAKFFYRMALKFIYRKDRLPRQWFR